MSTSPQIIRLVIVLAATALLFCGCSNRVDSNISKIQKGMTDSQVIDILGVPDKARTDFQALQTGPLGASTLFLYRGSRGWHRIIIFGTVVAVDSGSDDREDPQFPIEMAIKQTGPGTFSYAIKTPNR